MQNDLLLTQNIHATGVEFSERYVNIGKGALLSAAAGGIPTVLAAGTNGYMLVRDDAETTGLKWIAVSAGHAQGSDTGTTSSTFELDSDGFKIELTAESADKMGVKVDGGATYADFQAKDATFNRVTVSAAPSAGTDLTNKTYVDGLLAANDAMTFKGTIGVGGTLEIAAFNALATYQVGWSYKVITAGTIKGQVCEVNDLVVATVDRSGSGNVDGDFIVLQTNTDGVVTGPASSVDNYIALFSGTSGRLLKQSASPIGTMAYETATNYVTKALFDANTILTATTDNTPVALAIGASTLVGRKATGDISALTPAESRTILNVADGATNNTKATGAEINTGTDDVKFATAKAIADSTLVKGPASSVDLRIPLFSGTSGKLLSDSGKLLSDMGQWVAAPATKTSTGVVGQIARDDNFFYVCTASNIWKRSAIATNW